MEAILPCLCEIRETRRASRRSPCNVQAGRPQATPGDVVSDSKGVRARGALSISARGCRWWRPHRSTSREPFSGPNLSLRKPSSDRVTDYPVSIVNISPKILKTPEITLRPAEGSQSFHWGGDLTSEEPQEQCPAGQAFSSDGRLRIGVGTPHNLLITPPESRRPSHGV